MTAPPANVLTVVGGYRVTLHDQVHVVNKQRRCSCGRRACRAIPAVEAYLRAGGQRAPTMCTTTTSHTFPCPICQAEAHGSLERKEWACTLDRTHFFTWRVQRIQAARREALQSFSPYTREVLSAFASNETRTAFVAAHPLKYPAGA